MSQSSKKTSAESIIRVKKRTIYTAGRPPWYNCAGQQVEPFVIGENQFIKLLKKKVSPLKIMAFIDYCIKRICIGICGGSASGKTTVATKIIESLDVPWVTLLSMDSFYKVYFCFVKVECFASLGSLLLLMMIIVFRC